MRTIFVISTIFFLISHIFAQDSLQNIESIDTSMTSEPARVDSTTVDTAKRKPTPISAPTTRIDSLPSTPTPIVDQFLLTIDDALGRLLLHNPDIAEARYLWFSKQHTAYASWGDFEPKLVGRYNKQRSAPNGSVAAEFKNEYKLGVQGSLITGTQYDVGFNQTSYEHSLEKSTLYFGATVKQPLMRGVWFGAQWANQVLAKLDEKKSLQEYRTQLAEIIGKLFTAYWDYYYACQVLFYEKQSVNVAQSIFDDGIKRVEQGKLSRLDLTKAQAELAIRLSRKMDAESMVRDAQNQLSLLLADPTLLSNPNLNVELQWDENVSGVSESKLPSESIFQLNPAYLGQFSEVERLKIIKKAHIDQALPSVNLVGSYGISATNRSADMAIQTFEDPGLRDKVVSGGIEIEVPLIGNYKERHNVQAAEQNIRAAQLRLDLIGNQLKQDSEILQQRSTELRKQSRYERTSVAYHESELSSEIQKLDAGKSNYHAIFEIEEKLREAQKKELEVVRAFELNDVKLKTSLGRLLIDYGLEKYEQGQILLRRDLR